MTPFEEFKNKEKFIEDTSISYPGIENQDIKALFTERINQAANDFETMSKMEKVADKYYLDLIKSGLYRFAEGYKEINLEDRERICQYFEELMDLVSLDSSNGQLEEFIYNFGPLKG